MPLSIHTSVDSAKLTRILPRRFADRWRKFQLISPATVIILDDDVVRLAAIHRAFKKVSKRAAAPLVFVGRDFTEEARTFLLEHSASILDLQHFGWSDARELDFRILIGAKVKMPNQTAQTTPGLRPSVSDL